MVGLSPDAKIAIVLGGLVSFTRILASNSREQLEFQRLEFQRKENALGDVAGGAVYRHAAAVNHRPGDSLL